jgi:hypothetical protein
MSHKIAWVYLGLMVTFHPIFAQALEECSDSQIIRMVCGDPSSPVTDRRDDTGVGKTSEDIGRNFTRVRSKDVNVSSDAYKRFSRVYEEVVETYRQISENLPFASRTWMSLRLSKLAKTPSREDLKANRLYVVLGLGGSMYLGNEDYTKLSAFILNQTDLSETELFNMIAHEVGHGLDPEAYLQVVRTFRGNKREDVMDKEVQDCFLKSFPKGTSPSTEDYADWLASNALSKFIDSSPLKTDRARRALVSAVFYCPHRKLLNKAEDGSIYLLGGFLDGHGSPVQRILTTVSQPSTLAALGCSAAIRISKTRELLRACSLNDVRGPVSASPADPGKVLPAP